MRARRKMPEGWTAWTHGSLGYSRSQGDLRADLRPAMRGDLVAWQAEIWRGADRDLVLATAWGTTHWEAADAATVAMEELG